MAGNPTAEIGRRRFIWSAAAGGLVLGTALRPRWARAQGTVTLRYLNFGDRSSFWAKPFDEFARLAAEKSNGALEIVWAGGPEVVPPFQQPEAVSKGVFDMVHTATSYYAAAVPEAISLASGTAEPQALRTAGVIAQLDALHRAKFGVSFLGLVTAGVQYGFFAKEPLDSLAGFKGRKMRSIPLFDPILTTLGASTVTIAPFEIFTSLERGVVDGFGYPLITVADLKLHTLAPNLMRPAFYNSRTPLIMNLAAYDRLPAELQAALQEASIAAEQWGLDYTVGLADTEMTRLRAEGLKETPLSDAESAQFLDLTEETLWKRVIGDSPSEGPTLREAYARA